MEHQSQIDSILGILRNSLNKFLISLLLQQIFENPISVRQRLYGSKYENCVNMIEEYIKEKNMDPTVPPHLNYRLIKAIDFFHENAQVLDYFKDWVDDLKPRDKFLIETFKLFLTTAEHRLQKSAISELNKEKKLHKIYQENEKDKKSIEALHNILINLHKNLSSKEDEEEALIRKHEKDLAKYKYNNEDLVKQEIVNFSRNIRKLNISSGIRQKELEEELERAKITYERLLMANLKEEKSIRDEKNKLLHQLVAIIKRYDQTMGEKIKESIDLKEEYDKQKELFDVFFIEFSREEAEYERMVVLKEDNEQREREEKILLFMTNRAAKVIQKYWRKYKRAKKRAAKGKGKRK